jgi:hypothetical protein
MRIRTLKPEFWRNPDLARLPEFTRLLAIALLNYADDEGFFCADPALIRGELFPFLESSGTIQRGLTELANIHYVDLYHGTNGRIYGKVVTFGMHQSIDRKTPSKLKGCIKLGEGSLSPQGLLAEGSLLEQGTGNREHDRGGDAEPPAKARERNPLFDALAMATDGDPLQMTARQCRAVGVALAEIRKVCPELTVAELTRRAANYKLHMPHATLTANALASHWSRCDSAPTYEADKRPNDRGFKQRADYSGIKDHGVGPQP